MYGSKLHPFFEECSLTLPPGLLFCKKMISLVNHRCMRIGHSKILYKTHIAFTLFYFIAAALPPASYDATAASFPPPPPLLATLTPPLPSRHCRWHLGMPEVSVVQSRC